MRKLATLLVLLSVFGSFRAGALGLGDIQVLSALNEPLSARISVTSMVEDGLDPFKVTLGSRELFQKAGLDRPYVLTSLMFRVVNTGSDSVIHITSPAPMREPFLNFLVDVTWSQGRVIREYTILLDPPLYGAAISATVSETVTTVDSVEDSGVSEFSGSIPATLDVDIPDASQEVISTGLSIHTVKTGETLWPIARRYQPDGLTTQQTMLAILRANPEAFLQSNINRLKAGAILEIPSHEDVSSLSPKNAQEEVARQHSVWKEAQQPVFPDLPDIDDSDTALLTEVATDDSSEGIGSSAQENQSSVSQLSLVSGSDEGSDGIEPSPEGSALEDNLVAAQTKIDQQLRRNEELQSRLHIADEIITDFQSLVDIKDDDIAALQDRLTKLEAALAEATKQSALGEPSTPLPEVSTNTALESGNAVELDSGSIALASTNWIMQPLNQIQGNVSRFLSMSPIDPVLAVGGIGGILALILGGLFFAKRRRDKEEWVDLEVEDPVIEEIELGGDSGIEVIEEEIAEDDMVFSLQEAHADSPEKIMAASPAERNDEANVGIREIMPTEPINPVVSPPNPIASSADEDVSPQEGDPLEDLNIYLAYEDYENAAKLVEGVIAQKPDNPDYRLRLLEVYYAANNASAFEASALDLQNMVGETSPLMEKVKGWWNDLSPSRPLSSIADGDTSTLEEFDTAPLGNIDSSDRAATFEQTDEEHVAFALDEGEITPERFDVEDEVDSLDEVSATGLDVDFELDVGDLTEVEAENTRMMGESDVLPTSIENDLEFALDPSESELVESDVSELNLDFNLDDVSLDEVELTGASEFEIDLSLDEPTERLTIEDESTTLEFSLDEDDEEAAGLDDVQTKLDLARAYVEMGDVDAARSVLDEVAVEGDDSQKEAARALLSELN